MKTLLAILAVVVLVSCDDGTTGADECWPGPGKCWQSPDGPTTVCCMDDCRCMAGVSGHLDVRYHQGCAVTFTGEKIYECDWDCNCTIPPEGVGEIVDWPEITRTP